MDYDGQLKFGIWWIDCTQFTIDSIDVYTSNGSPTVTGATTRATQATTKTTTASTNGSSSSGAYEKNLNQAVDYDKLPSTDRMIGWSWKDLGVKSGDKVTKVEVNITAKSGEIGKWQGAFGSSTSVAPGYWTQSDDMTQVINSKSGTITWDVDAATSSIIQVDYDGQLKFGIWWIDCTQFTIDSIKVYTGNSSSVTTASTTKATTTTSRTTTTTRRTTASTTKATTTTTKTTGTQPNWPEATLYGDVNLDGAIDLTDAVLLNKAIAGSVSLSDQQKANANVCTDIGLSANDSMALLKFLVRLVDNLPTD